MAWAKVIQGSNWGDYDTTGYPGNKPLRPDHYRVRWPDGTITEELCQESCHEITIGDMGRDYKTSDCYLYFTREIHWHPIRIRLRGLEIEVADPLPKKTQAKVYWNNGAEEDIAWTFPIS